MKVSSVGAVNVHEMTSDHMGDTASMAEARKRTSALLPQMYWNYAPLVCVSVHMRDILLKLEAPSRAAALQRARELSLHDASE